MPLCGSDSAEVVRVKRAEHKTLPGSRVQSYRLQFLTHLYLRTRNATQEDSSMAETGQFKGIRGFLWLAVGFLLLAAAIESAIYIFAHLLHYL